ILFTGMSFIALYPGFYPELNTPFPLRSVQNPILIHYQHVPLYILVNCMLFLVSFAMIRLLKRYQNLLHFDEHKQRVNETISQLQKRIPEGLACDVSSYPRRNLCCSDSEAVLYV